MSTGPIKPFIDYSANTGGDDGQNTAASIQPFSNGEFVEQVVLQRTPENLRQRTENVRDLADDLLYWANADRMLAIGGPGLVTWPGSTTVAASGIPTISDTLYIMPFLTPGAAQTPPVPPVASAYGTLTLQRAGATPGITVASNRRSYAGGDKINIAVVFGGGAGTCSAQVSDDPERTVVLTANTPTLTTVIAVLTGIMVDSPAVQLVTATLAGGAAGTDLLLTPQAAQYITGNYDGEGHAITTAALAAFFAANPTSALAEGDTLCLQYASMVEDGALGGRRQSVPENSNTAMPSGSFFNSRVHPERLTNAIPICKVINNRLVFINGVQVASGTTSVALGMNILPLDNTFTGLNTFTKRITSSITGETDSDAARVSTVAPVTQFKPDFKSNGGALNIRGYIMDDGGYALISNAVWDSVTEEWHQENTGFASTKLVIGSDGMTLEGKADSSGTDWDDNSWDTTPIAADSEAESVRMFGALTVSGELQADGLVNGTGFVPLNGTIAGRVCMYTTGDNAITIEPFGLIVGGALYATPTAGFSLAAEVTGLTASTLYYIYAYVTGGAVAVEVVTTVPEPNTGRRTKTGDDTRVYLGAIRVTSTQKIKAFRRVDRRTTYLSSYINSTAGAALTSQLLELTGAGPTAVDATTWIPPWVTCAEFALYILGGSTDNTYNLSGGGVPVTVEEVYIPSGTALRMVVNNVPMTLNGSFQCSFSKSGGGTGAGRVFIYGYED